MTTINPAEHIGLAITIVKLYENKGIDVDDLRQEANLALVKAANAYDPSQGAFSTLAWRCITRRLFRLLQREWGQRRRVRTRSSLVEQTPSPVSPEALPPPPKGFWRYAMPCLTAGQKDFVEALRTAHCGRGSGYNQVAEMQGYTRKRASQIAKAVITRLQPVAAEYSKRTARQPVDQSAAMAD